MGGKSKYVLVVDNISSATPSKDVIYEMEYFGKVRDCVKDSKLRVALVEFDRADDAHRAWQKMDGFKMDGRRWKVDYADRTDFKLFGWKWFESSARSPSRSRSPSPGHVRSRSRSPPDTPYNKERAHGTSPRSPTARS